MVDWIAKNWGGEKVIVNNDKYCGKILYFMKDKKCSWHKHIVKQETFHLLEGQLLLKYGYSEDIEQAEEKLLEEGDVFEVPPGLCHQMLALKDSKLLEVSTTHFEEDSVRMIKGD